MISKPLRLQTSMRKKIFVDGLFYKGSGIGRYYSNLVHALLSAGLNVRTAVPQKYKDEFVNEFNSPNLEVEFVNYQKFDIVGFIAGSLKNFYTKTVGDFVWYPHINIPLFFKGERIIVTVHDMRPFLDFWDRSSFKRTIYKFLMWRAIRIAHRLVCISHSAAQDLTRFFPQAAAKIVIIPLAYDERPDKVYPTQPKNFKSGSPYVLFVGMRKPHKNLTTLIQAFGLIKDRVPHKLIIAGKKESSPDFVDQLIEETNMVDRVVTMTEVSDANLIWLYKNADWYIQPSNYEGFGLTPFEALAQDCPCLLSDIAAAREIFQDTGIYFDPDKVDDLANKLINVLNNPTCRQATLSRQVVVLKKYSFQSFKQNIVNFLELA